MDEMLRMKTSFTLITKTIFALEKLVFNSQ